MNLDLFNLSINLDLFNQSINLNLFNLSINLDLFNQSINLDSFNPSINLDSFDLLPVSMEQTIVPYSEPPGIEVNSIEFMCCITVQCCSGLQPTGFFNLSITAPTSGESAMAPSLHKT